MSYCTLGAGVEGPVEGVDGYYLYSVAMRTAGASGNNCDDEVDTRKRAGVCCTASVLQECKYYNIVIVFMYKIMYIQRRIYLYKVIYLAYFFFYV